MPHHHDLRPLAAPDGPGPARIKDASPVLAKIHGRAADERRRQQGDDGHEVERAPGCCGAAAGDAAGHARAARDRPSDGDTGRTPSRSSSAAGSTARGGHRSARSRRAAACRAARFADRRSLAPERAMAAVILVNAMPCFGGAGGDGDAAPTGGAEPVVARSSPDPGIMGRCRHTRTIDPLDAR